MTAEDRLPYIAMQKQYFDERVDIFCQPIPESIENRTARIVEMAGVDSKSSILDVGCGVGVLIKHFLAEKVKAENIVGCDLSDEMLSKARRSYPGVHFWQGDIVDLEFPLPETFPKHLNSFDRVFFNACFGNMWDQKETLQAALKFLVNEGLVILSHPLGAGFVEALKKSDPEIVPHSLPDLKTLNQWSGPLKFIIDHFEDKRDFYYVSLRKTDIASGTGS